MFTLPQYLDEINSRYENYPPNRPANLAANAELVEAMIGLAGESGEVLDILKKHLMYDKPLDQMKLLEELGDTFHYFLRIAHLCHFSLPTIMEQNAEKLRKRFKDGYSHEAAIKQAEKSEEIEADICSFNI